MKLSHKKVVSGIIFIVLAAVVIIVVSLLATVKLEKYPLSSSQSGWIAMLKKTPERQIGIAEYSACLDNQGNRIYQRRLSSGYEVGSTFYDRRGDYFGGLSIDDTGTRIDDGSLPNVHSESCKIVPEWFFKLKTHR